MANKLVLVPQDIWHGMVSTDTGEPNIDFARHELEKVKKERANASAKNLHYNQQLRRYLNLRNEREKRPTRVELANGLRMIMKTGNGDGSDDEIMMETEPRRMPPTSRQGRRNENLGTRRRNTRRRLNDPNTEGNSNNQMDQEDEVFEDARSLPPPSEATSAPVPTPFIQSVQTIEQQQQTSRGKKRKGSERQFAPQKWRLVEANNEPNKNLLKARFVRNRRRGHLQLHPRSNSNNALAIENEELDPNVPSTSRQSLAIQQKSNLKMMPTADAKKFRKWAPYPPNQIQRKTAARIHWATQRPTASIQQSFQSQALPSSDIQEALQAPFSPLALPAPPVRRQKFDPDIIRVVTAGIKKRKTGKLGVEVVPVKKSKPANLALPASTSRQQQTLPIAVPSHTRPSKRKAESISQEIVSIKRNKK